MQLTVSAAPRGRVELKAERGGVVVLWETITPSSGKQRGDVSKKLGCDVLAYLSPGAYEIPDPTSDAPKLSVTVRPITAPKSSGETLTGEPAVVIAEALGRAVPDGVVEWRDDDAACFLDVDYHHVGMEFRPESARLRLLMSQVQPQPVLWFESKGKGVHALYVRKEVRATLLAASAGFAFTQLDPTATFEVVSRSRLPSGCVRVVEPNADLSGLRRYVGGVVSDTDVDEWLEERGLQRGTAYDHTHCPAEPWRESRGAPVWVGEGGVICKSCEAKGVTLGSRRPGYFPYVSLCGSYDQGDVARMVENFTHWEHAKVVLDAKCRLEGKMARLVYEGLLRLRHPDDDRVDRVFRVGSSLIRGVGRWVTPDRYETLCDLRATLSTLPAVRGRDGKPIPERLDMFDQTADLGRYGYVSIRPLHGMRVYGEYLGGDGPVTTVVPPVYLAEPGQAALRPRYVPDTRRSSLDDAMRRVESVFPGLDRNYLLLLIAARGVSEGETGIAPNIVCAGPSGSGKSQTSALAASILGDNVTEVPWNVNTERFRQGFSEGAERGSYVVVNELFKDVASTRRSYRSGFDAFLNLTPGSVSHKLYVGPVPIGRLPVAVVTDTFVPSEVRSDVQLARRFVYVRLDSRLDWEQSIVDAGIGTPLGFRGASLENAEASNAIASYVVDRFFHDSPRSLVSIASDLGFTTLEHCDEVLDDPEALPSLFAEALRTPDAREDERLRGRGWKRICFDDETPLAEAWRSVCDGLTSFDAFANSRKCSEVDWARVVAVPRGTRLDVAKFRGKSIAIRFRCGGTRGEYLVNEQLQA